jgi:CubicO group peptidase (beta-lactamase class C family)
LRIRSFALLAALFCLRLSASQADTAGEIGRLMSDLHARGRFSGSVLVAVRGQIVYEGGFGAADIRTGARFTPATVSCLASVSKPFTAMAAMMLAEQGRLAYGDTLDRYFPELPRCYGAVSLRNLLTMTSGIVDYPQLGADHPGMTNGEVVAALRRHPSLAFQPGERYAYCNANYVLLSMIVEKVAGVSFRSFLQERIFDRLGMVSTFVYSDPRQKTGNVAVGYDEAGKPDDYVSCTTGDGGVYSSVGDLFKWDQALTTGMLVSPSSLALAFTPATVGSGTSTYGFGWNVTEDRHGRSVWHTGNTCGFRAYIHRGLTERNTVIMLTNGGQTDRIAITEAIIGILSQGPHHPP